jgi:hypothetical protein
MSPGGEDELLPVLGRQAAPRLEHHERHGRRLDSPEQVEEDGKNGDRHAGIVAHPGRAPDESVGALGAADDPVDSGAPGDEHVDQNDLLPVDTESGFAQAIREHLELKDRNAGLDDDMPIDRYLDGDPLENHPLFKSEEQARIEETMEGEPAAELSSDRLPWPGEETVEDVEGPALDEALWTGRPRDFDWGD